MILDVNQLRQEAALKAGAVPKKESTNIQSKQDKSAIKDSDIIIITTQNIDNDHYQRMEVTLDSITLDLINPTNKKHFVFDIKDKTLMLNNAPTNDSFLSVFKEKYQKLKADLRNGKAKAFVRGVEE